MTSRYNLAMLNLKVSHASESLEVTQSITIKPQSSVRVNFMIEMNKISIENYFGNSTSRYNPFKLQNHSK